MFIFQGLFKLKLIKKKLLTISEFFETPTHRLPSGLHLPYASKKILFTSITEK